MGVVEVARAAAISIRVEPAVKDRLDELAKADRRPLSSYIEKVLIEHLEQASSRR